MKKNILLVALLALFALEGSAQNYNWSLGLRGGGIVSGLDARVNLDPSSSLHMMLGLSEGMCLYGLYECNVPVISRGFNFYYGGGLHLGTWGGWDKKGEFTFGLDAIAGLEYKMQYDPIVFALDYKPCVNFTGKTGFWGYDLGLSVKYCF